MTEYLIQSPRLGLRLWQEMDLDSFAAMNQDPKVMEYFPRHFSEEESAAGLRAYNSHFEEHGFTYYAADRLDTQQFIGLVGIKYQTFECHFTPCIDIGWRLRVDAWGKGFATEGAIACLNHGFLNLNISTIYSYAPALNVRSIGVMKRIGMQFVEQFDHPGIKPDSPLRTFHLYRIDSVLEVPTPE